LRAGTSSSRAGFTFIELAIVLLLLGILLAIAAPRFASMVWQGSSKAAARRMYGVVATVHDKAALQKRRYWLAMQLGQGDYWAVVAEPGKTFTPEEVLGLKDTAVMSGTLPGKVVFKDVVLNDAPAKEGVATAVFEANGTCDGLQIHLQDEGGGAATIMVNPLTGRCSVYDSYLSRQTGEKSGSAAEKPALTDEFGQVIDEDAAKGRAASPGGGR
jgi:prepilin-type N-terminal cleavage/methylation domain-containing protein